MRIRIPARNCFDDVAEQILSGDCLAGGSNLLRLDENLFVASLISRLWNYASRMGRWLAGSFIFVEATAFRRGESGFDIQFFAAEELELSVRLKKLAREKGRRITVLYKHPMVTSARKLRLYTFWEHFKLLGVVIFNRRALMRRESCTIWYDGRR